MTHGLNGYTNRDCRCAVCRAAGTAYQQQRRRELSELPIPAHVHGINGYSNYRCRCNVCRAAARDAAVRRNRARAIVRLAARADQLGYRIVPKEGDPA